MSKTRVVIVEDSLTMRMHLSEILSADPALELVAAVENGKEAIQACLQFRPDVITMDMMMPVMSGLAATEYIMAHCPTPILVVSSSTNRGELFKTYEALAAGAVDVLEKPGGTDADESWGPKYISAVKLTARIRVITHLRARLGNLGQPRGAAPSTAPFLGSERRVYDLIAIGASTGGPGAIVEILRALPAKMTIPILFVLHINEPFGSSFAEWLDGQTTRPVALAREGESVAAAAGRVLMAPPGRHMTVRSGRIRLTLDAERHSCRPSVDTLFESIASAFGRSAAACLLTGMGRDGATGLLDIRKAGGLTIAQDEATCIAYGMPREAAILDAAERVLPLDEIGPALSVLSASSSVGQP